MEKWRRSLDGEATQQQSVDLASSNSNISFSDKNIDSVNKDVDELSFKRKLLFGMAAPPLQMSANVVGFFFNVFLLEVAKLNPLFISVILFSGRAWDAITDPIAGQLVSKTSTRWGRCRPWMLIATPLGCVVFFLLWMPITSNDWISFVYYFFIYLLYCTLITCYHVPFTSSTMLIAKTEKDKDGATAFRMAFELLGTIVGVGLFGFIIGSARIASDCGKLPDGIVTESMKQKEINAYFIGTSVIVFIYFACGMCGFFGIKEKYRISSEMNESFISNIKAVLQFRPYIQLMMAFLFMSLGVQIVQVNLALYTTHSLDLGNHMAYGIVVVLVVAIVAIPFWYKMSVKFGKKNIFMVGIIIFIPCLLTAMLVPRGSVVIFYAVLGFSGLAISVSMLLPWSMLPDVIDDYYVKHGVRREATFYSLYVFFNKFAVGISMAASQITLGLSEYDSASCEQDHKVSVALRYLIGPGPIFCLLCSLAFVFFFPIDNEYRKDISSKLAQLHSIEKPHREDSEKCDNLTLATEKGAVNKGYEPDTIHDQEPGYNTSTLL